MLELVPVAHAHDSVCQLHGTPVFIHIGDPHQDVYKRQARELCSVLVKDGYEDETVLRQWKEMGFGLPYLVHGPETFMVPMRDGVKLAADVYLPVKREGAVAGPEGRVPTVLVRTPYGKRVGAETYYRYVQRGYAVVIQDVRGREDSEGEWLPMHYEVCLLYTSRCV